MPEAQSLEALVANPIVWFAELQQALQKRDQEQEERARRQLVRLGVGVVVDLHSPMRRPRRGKGSAA